MLSNLFAAYHFVTSWWQIVLSYGTAGLIMAGLIALGIFLPFGPRIRLYCWVAASAVLATTIAYSVGQRHGGNRVKADWDWTLQAEQVEGEKARTDAERVVRPEPRDSQLLRDDEWNRDTQPVVK